MVAGPFTTPAGTLATVRVLPIVDATRRERFVAVIAGEGRAEHSLPCGTAVEAARWSERVRLS